MNKAISHARFRVAGMDCAGCAAKIDAAVRRVDGVSDVTVSATTGILRVTSAGEVRSEVEAAVKADVPYLLIVGGAGSLYVAPGVQLVDVPQFPAMVYPVANAARNLLNKLRARNDVNWSFICPPASFAGGQVSYERTGKYRVGKDDVLMDKDGKPADISVADMAVAIADDVEHKAHLRERFTVAAK